ncbi:Aldo/keto reductase [Schizopora paradoxa]|uniref:Aldo/keto reductase n=1 Tax=Schizopora paradoxa TaxID=27342 RepID=A0A0H2RDI1_9AGAM|nr:Aldo/keto reductase [Schizopora paradoxa]
MKTISLSDGTSTPWLAFGTGTAYYQKAATDGVLLAFEHGFTHIDAAQIYMNEESVGDAIAASKKPRGDMYITTKLYQLAEGQTVSSSLEGSLKKLKVDYVDLFLIHMPQVHDGKVVDVWKGMVEAKKKGLTKSIGVSNFNVKYLEQFRATGLEMPVVNQIEFHPFVYHMLVPLLKYHSEHGIITSSYGGLSPILPRSEEKLKTQHPKERKDLLDALEKLAAARSDAGKKVTHDQILFKWLQAKNILAVTTSSNAARLDGYVASENLSELSEEEQKLIESAVGTVTFKSFEMFTHMEDQTA